MSEDTKRIIEIAGVKVEIDLREAKTIETYRVGDPVKLLKKGYGDSWICSPGVIIGFAAFQNRPALEILYISDVSGAGIQVATLTQDSKDIEIAPFNGYEAAWTRTDILGKLDRELLCKEEEVRLLKSKREAFVRCFGKFFPKVET